MIEIVLAVIQNKLRDLEFHCPGPPPPHADDIGRMIDAIEDIVQYFHEVPIARRDESIEPWVNDLEDRVDEWEYANSSSRRSTQLSKIADDVKRKRGEIIGSFVLRAQDVYDVRASGSPSFASVLDVAVQEREVRILETWLSEEKPQFRTIYVSGKVGSGKSRVVSKACDRVKRQFHTFHWVWICGSPLSIRKAKNTLKACNRYIEENAQKRYLLVLDGIELDATNIQDYQLPLSSNNGGGGRVVIITRSSIPTHQQGIQIGPLSQGDDLHLFHAKASQHLSSSNSSSRTLLPPDQVNNILSKCGGSPLLISLIGGLVSTKGKDDQQAWIEAVDKLKNDHLLGIDDQLAAGDKVDEFLRISYTSLRPLVKACFLYTCVMFPKDMEISKTQLIGIWLAEGFVQRESNNITAEEVAEIYFKQLIQRSMLEIVGSNDNGDVKTCRVLQPMQSFATKISSSSPNLSFICSIDGNDDDQCGFLRNPHHRRVSINTYRRSISQYIINNSSGYPKLRSLLFWGEIQQPWPMSTHGHSNNICNLFSRSKLIRVLILQAIPVEKVASDVLDRLLLLRYLGLKSTPIKDLQAASLGRLQKLETLDVRGTEILKSFPQCTRSLVKLRHLLLTKSGSEEALQVPLQFLSGSTDLQTLTGLDLMGVVGSLSTKLRKFSVKVREEHSGYLCTSLNTMEFLRSLTIYCAHGHLNIASLINDRLSSLAKLSIGGEIDHNSLQTISKFDSVVSLSLWDSNLDQDPLSTLHCLPNLVRLTLHTAYTGTEIHPLHGGFSSLKHMSIFKLHNLERWGEIGTAAMTNLKTLKLTGCGKLRQPPEGLQNRGQRLEMCVQDMNSDFVAAVRRGSYTVRII